MRVLDTIGNTPLVELSFFSPAGRRIFAKLEGGNPAGSIKDRVALSMVRAAEDSGLLRPGGVIVEPTSGNTGIGLAMVAAARGYRCVIVMPESMSVERRRLLERLGAEVVLTPAGLGMKGAVDEAKRIVEETPGAFMPDQFSNPANPAVHRATTAPEIEVALLGEVGRPPDFFVAGVGTGGTITGVAQYFKLDRGVNIVMVAVEPEESAVLSGRPPGVHGIQGIGAGFVPPIFDGELVDAIETVSTDEARATSAEVAKREGIAVGISSGANLAAAIRVAERAPEGAVVVTVFPDRVDRYLSII